jgi:alkanesulfonate monooxygenase SsuD/methylene tetrahydromethanopterin reductase-like flavin-dependent oxidoreductase (luciferase family)
LRAALPWVDAWNTWFDWYGNTPEGFARGNAEISSAIEAAGRAPDEVDRSACLMVAMDGAPGERTHDAEAPPVPSTRVVETIRAMGEAGADEVILVVDPITERSIEELGAQLAAVLTA